jgi:FkbM family methyltransferase
VKTFWPINICGHTFLPMLDGNSLVLDLGANKGEFTHNIIDRFGCRVVALEAMSDLVASIEPHQKLLVFQEAIAGKTGSIELNRYEKRCASVLGPMADERPVSITTVKSVSLHDLMVRESIDKIDLVKVDIEGEELAMFDAATDRDLLSCKQITVEFHDFLYPDTHDRVENAKGRLASLGFRVVQFSLNNTDVLFINPSAGISPVFLTWLKTGVKYGRGITRRLKRAFNPQI